MQKIIADSTGMGDPIVEVLKKRGLNIEGYKFTNTSKKQLIEHLAALLKRQEISYPDIKVATNTRLREPEICATTPHLATR